MTTNKSKKSVNLSSLLPLLLVVPLTKTGTITPTESFVPAPPQLYRHLSHRHNLRPLNDYSRHTNPSFSSRSPPLKPLFLSSSSSDPPVPSSDPNNWIERSTPTGISTSGGGTDDDDEAADYSLGISGDSFETGPLSTKIYDALTSVASRRFPSGVIPDDLIPVYETYAMELTAKEAVMLAVKQNGLDVVPRVAAEKDGGEEMWGDVEDVVVDGTVYPGVEDAVRSGTWRPGSNFSFVARNVRCQKKEMSVDEILAALDPDGKIRGEIDDRLYDPAERIVSLAVLAEDNERRCNAAPVEAAVDGFVGEEGVRGYAPLTLRELGLLLGEEEGGGGGNPGRLMDAMESHSCVVVKLPREKARVLKAMWDETQSFFSSSTTTTEDESSLPKMSVSEEAGSKHAVVGYASYDDGAMRFLETRLKRHEDELVPRGILRDDGIKLISAFRLLANLGRDIVATAVAAAAEEAAPDDDDAAWKERAVRLVTDLVDDGSVTLGEKDTGVCMSPHRLCRYSHASAQTDAREIFGAHTDTSFVTIVPVAETNGLEVFDEMSEKWIRPELIARKDWEAAGEEESRDDADVPWYCHYVVIMPGELMQIVTRGMILSAVHRVVGVSTGDSRLSAPILLRARSKAVMDVERYFGDDEDAVGPLVRDCAGLTMEDLHDALQPGAKG